jgi:hypothetical protein
MRIIWTFNSNRNWGERTSSSVVMDPLTGEPLLQTTLGLPGTTAPRNWELYIENWSDSVFILEGLEITWHGKPIAAGTQRVQGFVGIDTNSDEDFNYERYEQFVFDTDLDPATVRGSDVQRPLDLTQEPFAENVLVEAYRVVNGVVEADPTARFLSGADGNYYFDLVPDTYVIRVTDPEGRVMLEDVNTPTQFLQHFKQEWMITPEWFFAWDREDGRTR